jgi:hypothetical protein
MEALKDPRYRILLQLRDELRENAPVLRNLQMKNEIHSKAARLFDLIPLRANGRNVSYSQEALAEIFDRLDLWDASDIPIFLPVATQTKRLAFMPYAFALLLENWDEVTPEQKIELANQIHTQTVQKHFLSNLLVLYRTGEMSTHKLPFLIKYLAEESVLGTLQNAADDPTVFAQFPSGIKEQRQQVFKQNVKLWLQAVTHELHARYRAHDPTIVHAFEAAKSQLAGGKGFSDTQKKARSLAFLAAFETDCAWRFE